MNETIAEAGTDHHVVHSADRDGGSGEWFPLSEMQKAYLVGRGDTLPLGQVSSHVYHEFRLDGCDPLRLALALLAVVQRHETLRTVVRGDGMQRVLPASRLPRSLISSHDATQMTEDAVRELLANLRHAMVAQVAPLDRPCALDVQLVCLPSRKHMLLVSHDGLHVDGLSMQILFAEWAAFYRQPTLSLPPLTGLFELYVRAEHRQRASQAWSRARNYWKARVDQGLAPAPQLPLAADPLSLPRGVTSRFEVALDEASWHSFMAHARAASVTDAAAIFAAYCEVLGYWGGRSAQTLNVTLANRMPVADDIDEAIGNFTSSVLVGTTGVQTSFSLRAKAAQAALLESLEYRQCNALDVTRLLAGGTGQQAGMVIPYTFNYAMGTTQRQGELRGVETLGAETFCASQTPQIWLNAFVTRTANGIAIQLDAVDGLFAPGVIAGVAASLQALLRLLSDDASAWDRGAFDLLPPEQRLRREAVNDTTSPVPAELMHESFVRRAMAQPDAVALRLPGRTISYRQLHLRASALAAQLLTHEIRPDEPVAVILDKGLDQVAALLAVSLAGGAYLPVDTAWPRPRRDEIFAIAMPRVFIVGPGIAHQDLPEGRLIFTEQARDTDEVFAGMCTATPDHLAYVMFTSGTTGKPKGVMVSHGSVVNLVRDINTRLSVDPQDRALGISAYTFDLSVYDVFGLLSAGGSLVLPEPARVADPAHWLELAQNHHVTLLNGVPAAVQMLLAHGQGTDTPLPRSLRLVMMSGDRIPPSLPLELRRSGVQAQLWSLGGPTETCVWNIGHLIGEIPAGATHIPYGKPLANSQYHILDAMLRDCPDGVAGDMYAAGAGLARGYLGDTALTRECFVAHPRTGQRLYRTGDIGRYLPDGNIEILGRSDFQVKVNGYRIELNEVEARLAEHPLVQACAVVGPGPQSVHAGLVAFVTMVGRGDVLSTGHIKALQDRLAAALPDYMVPQQFVQLASLPLSGNAKVDRMALCATPVQVVPQVTPASATQATGSAVPSDEQIRLTTLWSELLKVKELGPDQNFFQLGGDSIKAARLTARLRKEFGITASLAQVMKYQTVREMARFVAEQTQAKKVS